MAEKADWLTVAGLAALATIFGATFHQGIHALTALAIDGQVRTFAALSVDSLTTATWQVRVIAGSASIASLWAGTALWLVLRGARQGSLAGRWFLWLLMLMTWLPGAGDWVLSGAAGVGDFAAVIARWSGQVEWRIGLLAAGAVLFVVFVWLALRVFGSIAAPAAGPAALTYLTSAAVIAAAGAFDPHGMGSPAVTPSLVVFLCAPSPLIWMMSWLRAKMFAKTATGRLAIPRSWPVIGIAAAAVVVFCLVLGRGVSGSS